MRWIICCWFLCAAWIAAPNLLWMPDYLAWFAPDRRLTCVWWAGWWAWWLRYQRMNALMCSPSGLSRVWYRAPHIAGPRILRIFPARLIPRRSTISPAGGRSRIWVQVCVPPEGITLKTPSTHDTFGAAKSKAVFKNAGKTNGSFTADLRFLDTSSGGTLGCTFLVVFISSSILSSN